MPSPSNGVRAGPGLVLVLAAAVLVPGTGCIGSALDEGEHVNTVSGHILLEDVDEDPRNEIRYGVQGHDVKLITLGGDEGEEEARGPVRFSGSIIYEIRDVEADTYLRNLTAEVQAKDFEDTTGLGPTYWTTIDDEGFEEGRTYEITIHVKIERERPPAKSASAFVYCEQSEAVEGECPG